MTQKHVTAQLFSEKWQKRTQSDWSHSKSSEIPSHCSRCQTMMWNVRLLHTKSNLDWESCQMKWGPGWFFYLPHFEFERFFGASLSVQVKNSSICGSYSERERERIFQSSWWWGDANRFDSIKWCIHDGSFGTSLFLFRVLKDTEVELLLLSLLFSLLFSPSSPWKTRKVSI